ncbi:MAG: ABC transporter ATP-binding protein [Burkholderiales bacterium]|nr:ABC transporter ATP-binding protein [Burkholderiales bacterium]
MNSADWKPPILQVQDVRFRWPRSGTDCIAIDHFEMARGERVFLRGPSGCGKSTLLSLIAGVQVAQSGRVVLLDHEWTRLSSTRRDRIRVDHVGYIFQQFNLLPYLSVLDNVVLPCRFSARRAVRAEEREGGRGFVAEGRRLLQSVGLGEAFWNRRASDLSVGQQQRVAAARALIGDPELIVADEPTSALDEDLRESFMQMLMQSCAAAGSALLFVSHDSRLAALFDREVDLPRLNRAGQTPMEQPA